MNATEEVMVDRLREAPQCVNIVFSAHTGPSMKELEAAIEKLFALQLEVDKRIFQNWAKECPDGKPPIPFEQWREEKEANLRAKLAADAAERIV